MAFPIRERMAELTREWHEARRRHPRITVAVAAAFALVALLSVTGGVWFLTGLRDGLPDADAMRRIGEMDQATAVFDAQRSAGVHHLQGAAHRSAAGGDVAAI